MVLGSVYGHIKHIYVHPEIIANIVIHTMAIIMIGNKCLPLDI